MSLEHSAKGGRAEGWPMYLSVREVAHELRLSRRRVYQLCNVGELKRVKIGAATRITSASLLALAQRADAGEQIAEFVRGRPKATVGRKGAGLRSLPRKDVAEHTKPAKPKDTPPPEPAAPPDRMFGDRRYKAARKPRHADRAPDPAEQEA